MPVSHEFTACFALRLSLVCVTRVGIHPSLVTAGEVLFLVTLLCLFVTMFVLGRLWGNCCSCCRESFTVGLLRFWGHVIKFWTELDQNQQKLHYAN